MIKFRNLENSRVDYVIYSGKKSVYSTTKFWTQLFDSSRIEVTKHKWIKRGNKIQSFKTLSWFLPSLGLGLNF